MASGKQYTLSVLLKMAGQQPAKKALDSLSSGLKDVRENAKGASSAVADSARSAAGASTSWRLLGRTVRAGVSGVAFAAKGVGSVVKTGLLLPFRAATLAAGVLKGALVGLAGVAVSTWLQIKGAMAALRPAAEMEQYSIQLEVLTKSAAVASRRLAQLKEYARTTNFSPKEVIEASNLMQAFGLWTDKGMRRLRAAGDAANAFGKSITEVVTAMNYLSSGRSGEAFEALSRIGVTRQALKPFGLEFKKSGELITEPKKAVDIVFAYLERQFGGMTARQSRTWKGAIQQLGGEVYNTFSEGMKKALKPMTSFVTGRVIPAVNAIGKALKAIDWQKALARPLAMLGGLLGAIRLAADPSTRSTGIEQLKGIVKDMAAVGKAALNGLGGIVSGLLKDGAAMLENFITGGGVQSVMKTLFAGLVSAFRFGTAIFRATLDGFSDKFRSDLLSVMPGSSGDYERRKRSNMIAQTFAELFPAESARIMADKRLSHRPPDSMFGGEWVPLSEAVTQERRMNAMKAYVNGLTGSARSKWESEFSRNMGWNEGRRQSSVNYFDGVLDPLKEAAKDTASRVKGLRLDNTGEAVKKAAGGIVDALGAVSGRLRRIDLMDDVQAKRKALQASASAELSRLRRIGWDSRGRVRQEETPREAQARLDYFKKLQLWRSQDARLAAMLPQGGKGQAASPQMAQRGNPQAARYIPPQVADKQKQRGANAAKEADQAAKDEKRDMADKANIQSAVYLDDIRRYMSRLVAILGQDIGGAGVPATPQ
jgi:hypothetical protein